MKKNFSQDVVLIIDNEAINRSLLAGILRPEFEVLEAESGEDAFELLAEYPDQIAAVILDIIMPGMSGYEFLKKLRETEYYASIPVIVSTALSEEEAQIHALELGANGFASKPFDPDFIRNTIRNSINLRMNERKLLDDLPCGAALYDFDGKELTPIHINRKYWELVDRPAPENNRYSVLDPVHVDDRAAILKELADAIREERDVICDFRVRYGKNGYRAFHTLGTIKKLTNDHCSVLVTYEPISDETLGYYKQLKLLTDNIPCGLAAFEFDNGNTRMLYCNEGFYSFSGYSRKEYLDLVKDDPYALMFQEDKPAFYALFQTLVETQGKHPVGELRYRCRAKDGNIRWFSLKGSTSEVRKGYFVLNVVQYDITAQQEVIERLRVSEEFNRLAIEHSSDIVSRFDVKTGTLTLPDDLDPKFQVPTILHNVPEEQIALGRISPETAAAYSKMFEEIKAGSPSGSATYQQNSTEGWLWLKSKYSTVFSSDGEPVFAVITFTNITDQLEKDIIYRKWQQSLDEREESEYTLFRCNLSKGYSYDSREGGLLSFQFKNKEKKFDDLVKEAADQILYPEDLPAFLKFLNSDTMLASYYRGHRSDSLEFRVKSRRGGYRWLRLSVELVEYPRSHDVEAYLMFEDIDESKREDLSVLERAEKDPLTGLLNRGEFVRLTQDLMHRNKEGQVCALLMLDIDEFKQINDTFGHTVGDQVLTALADGLRSVLRHDDLIGRLGGDEFVAFLPQIPDAETACATAERICALDIGPKDERGATVSIGIALFPRYGADFEALYKSVDEALYAQKRRGKNGYVLFGRE